MRIRVSPCGHFFQQDDGSPFFFLADTVWVLFNKLTVGEARSLFADRRAKGFTVIQAVVFRDLFEPNTPNVNGDPPFLSDDDMFAVRLNPAWMAHLKSIVAAAGESDLFVGLLPTWGDKWNDHSNSAGPVIMDRERARVYGRSLSDQLADFENIVWILGGDSPILRQDHADTIQAMAEGIRSGGSSKRLMTFHPTGADTSEVFHSAAWLDFNSIQTSHDRPNLPGYVHVERLYANRLPKPCLDMEPNYESSPMFVMKRNRARPNVEPLFSAYDVRKSLYRTVLAGAAGFTYGSEPIRQLYRSGERVHIHDTYAMPGWQDALSDPGSGQLRHLVDILISRSYFTRIPAQHLFVPVRQYGSWADRISVGMHFAGQENTDPVSHVQIARCSEGSYIYAYVPVRQVVTLRTSELSSREIAVTLYDPETGQQTDRYTAPNEGTITVVPTRDLDTFIVLDAVGTAG